MRSELKFPIAAGSSATTGYLIFSALAVVLFALAFKDPMFIVFGIPLLLVFILAASAGKGSVDQDLKAIGWSNSNAERAIPLGIGGGIAALIIGGWLVEFTSKNTAAIVPDMSAVGVLAAASVIPPSIAISANIISQWLVVAPAEESGYRVLAVYAGQAVFKNPIIAYILASLLWIATHIPTFIMQGTSVGMYYVLALIAVITLALFWFTGNILSAILAHGTFNTGVTLASQGIDLTTLYVLATIGIVLSIAYLYRPKAAKRRG